MDSHISSFIKEQGVLTICTSNNNIPYSATCFYSFLKEKNYLVFKSSPQSKHITDGLLNNNVSGTIIADSSNIAQIKGIQFQGKFIQPTLLTLSQAKKNYTLKYPFSVVIKGGLWIVELEFVKMTDNTLGFGKKISWEKEVSSIKKIAN